MQIRPCFLGLTAVIIFGCGERNRNESRSYDAGPVFLPAHGRLKHSFVVTNPYEVPVVFRAARKSCTCTDAALRSSRIAPGGKTELDMSIDVKNIFKDWTVQCILDADLESEPEWVYEIKYRTYPAIRFGRETISLNSGDGDQPLGEEIAIEEYAPELLNSENEVVLASDSNMIKCTKIGLPEAGLLESGRVKLRRTRYRLNVSGSSGNVGVNAAGLVAKNIRGESASAIVTWSAKSALSLAPAHVFFGGLSGGQLCVTKSVCISAADQLPFRLCAVDPCSDWLNVELGPSADGGRSHVIKITLSVKSIMKDRRYLSGNISVRTDHPKMAAISIPWSAILQQH